MFYQIYLQIFNFNILINFLQRLHHLLLFQVLVVGVKEDRKVEKYTILLHFSFFVLINLSKLEKAGAHFTAHQSL